MQIEPGAPCEFVPSYFSKVVDMFSNLTNTGDCENRKGLGGITRPSYEYICLLCCHTVDRATSHHDGLYILWPTETRS